MPITGGAIMSLIRWDPFSNIATLQDRINRLFDDAFPRTAGDDDELSAGTAWRPYADIFETESGVTILMDLPGVDKENVSVEVKENILSITGSRACEEEVDESKYYRRERSVGSFKRSFGMRGTIAPDKIKASFKNGVLKIELAKPLEEKPRQVSVQID
jgi:HSP20 family protein